VKKVDHLSVRVDSLEQVKITQSTQLENCLRSVTAVLTALLTRHCVLVLLVSRLSHRL